MENNKTTKMVIIIIFIIMILCMAMTSGSSSSSSSRSWSDLSETEKQNARVAYEIEKELGNVK